MSITFAGQPAVEDEYTIEIKDKPALVIKDSLPEDATIMHIMCLIFNFASLTLSDYEAFARGNYTLGQIICQNLCNIFPGYNVYTRYHGLGVEPDPEVVIILCHCDFNQVINNHIALFYTSELELVEIRIVFNDNVLAVWCLGQDYIIVEDGTSQYKLSFN